MYYIFEAQHRDDGIINMLDVVTRSNLQMAKSYYHDRYSKMSATKLYPSVSLLLTDENLRKIEWEGNIETMYKPPEPEPEEPEVTEPPAEDAEQVPVDEAEVTE